MSILSTQDLRDKLSCLLQLDRLVLNVDRHLNNIVLVMSDDGMPDLVSFDYGDSLGSDLTFDFTVDKSAADCISDAVARPFSSSFDKQCEMMRQFSDFTLKLNSSDLDVSDLVDLVPQKIFERMLAILDTNASKYLNTSMVFGVGDAQQVIDSFRGEYRFLSNFYEAPVTYIGITYGSSEAAFQAQKCCDPKDRIRFAQMSPVTAKKEGRRVLMCENWDKIKYGTMYGIVYAKFSQNPDLAKALIATGDAYLEEGNTWGDRTWGTVNGEGQNWLGKILMEVRTILRKR